MKHILSKSGIEALAAFARARVLLAFDFDGTLAPIVPDCHRATMRERTRDLLDEVCRQYPCAVISGRGRRDVCGRLLGTHVKRIVGNHGLEPSKDMAPLKREIAMVRTQLIEALEPSDGIEIEDKRYSLSLHYRSSPNKPRARRMIRAAVSRLTLPMRIVAGKLVFNVVPAGSPHKGDALVALRRQAGAQQALYLGDDITDEDVFRLDRSANVLSVRIGRSDSSAASYYLRDQREVDALLARLVVLRSAAATP